MATKQQTENTLQILLTESIRVFAGEFCNSSRELFVDASGALVHAGEFGAFRESITRDFLRAFTPERMGIDSGFVVTSAGRISTQCDIVVYDRTVTPLLQSASRQRFFPAESVCAVGEIKSVVSLHQLKSALRKLASTKFLRECLSDPAYVYTAKDFNQRQFTPALDERDQLVTFIICEKFDFNILDKFSELVCCYTNELPKFPFNLRHNLVLSISDGLLCYLYPKGDGIIFPFPSKVTEVHDFAGTAEVQNVHVRANVLKNRLIIPPTGSVDHIKHFCTMLHHCLNSVSVLFPDMGNYIVSQQEVGYFDVEAPR